MTKKKEDEKNALGNRLLAALPKGEFEKIEPSLELVERENGDVLWEVEEKRKHLYFPTSMLICLLHETDRGLSAEVGVVGHEGVAGVSLFMGDPKMADRAVVQRGGVAYRMKSKAVKEEFAACGDFQDLLMSYTQSLITHISQTAVCYRLHSIDQQLARWLLINNDHQGSKTFEMTHEQIASILGVRRESVSVAAGKLQDLGLIKCGRGRIKLVDRKGMEGLTCECYSVVKENYERMLKDYTSQHK
ncbi:MAG: Crp/Fnr family transcriptional regulator [Pyrinomonadaceae bacterium]